MSIPWTFQLVPISRYFEYFRQCFQVWCLRIAEISFKCRLFFQYPLRVEVQAGRELTRI
jgi:hypothetical protein